MWCNHPLNEQQIRLEQYADQIRLAQQEALSRRVERDSSRPGTARRLITGLAAWLGMAETGHEAAAARSPKSAFSVR